jgi:hypothetical protein
MKSLRLIPRTAAFPGVWAAGMKTAVRGDINGACPSISLSSSAHRAPEIDCGLRLLWGSDCLFPREGRRHPFERRPPAYSTGGVRLSRTPRTFTLVSQILPKSPFQPVRKQEREAGKDGETKVTLRCSCGPWLIIFPSVQPFCDNLTCPGLRHRLNSQKAPGDILLIKEFP